MSTTLRLIKSTLISEAETLLFKSTGIDILKPNNIYLQITNTCNSKCMMCDCWRTPKNDLPSRYWIRAIRDISKVNPDARFGIAGGEVFLKENYYRILKYCSMKDLSFGITTNGILLNQKNIAKLLRLNIFNINISLDSLNSKTYERIRGVSALPLVLKNISKLVEHKRKIKHPVKIFIKTTVNKFNIHELIDIAEFTYNEGLDGITYQPIIKTTDECEEMTCIPKDLFLEHVNRLIRAKKKTPIIRNSDRNINDWQKEYYSKPTLKKFCTVPLKNLYIKCDGSVTVCEFGYKNLGNIKDRVSRIIRSNDYSESKKDRSNCGEACIYCVDRNLNDYVTIARSMLAAKMKK